MQSQGAPLVKALPNAYPIGPTLDDLALAALNVELDDKVPAGLQSRGYVGFVFHLQDIWNYQGSAWGPGLSIWWEDVAMQAAAVKRMHSYAFFVTAMCS